MDMVARIGGEEFGVILPGCAVPFAHSAAERIREGVAQACALTSDGVRLQATVSIGGAFAGDVLKADPVLWCARADHQLYRAKNEGRDRACIERPVVSDVSADERALLFAWALDDREGEAQ